MKLNHVILVILYNKKPEESNTLSCLESTVNYNSKIVIVNNGPSAWGPESIKYIENVFRTRVHEFVISEFINNKPLSILYNDFIKENKGKKYFTFFDDDSDFESDFFKFISQDDESAGIYIPVVISKKDKINYYPVVSGKIIKNEGWLNEKKTFSIASGLTLTSDAIDKMKLCYASIFDENYALYGVDMSIFRRVSHMSEKNHRIKIKCVSSLYHSLSRIDEAPSKFRSEERLIDACLTARHYYCLENIIFLVKVFIKECRHIGVIHSISMGMRTIIKGSHPRSISWKKMFKL